MSLFRPRLLMLGMMLCALCVPAFALADTVTLTDKTVYQTVSDGDSIFLLTADGVLSYAPADGTRMFSAVPVITGVTMEDYDRMSEPDREKVEAGVTQILVGDDGLWGMNAYAGTVGRIDAQGIHWADVSFDTTDWYEPDDCPTDRPLSAFVDQNTVYIYEADGLRAWDVDECREFRISIPVDFYGCVPYHPHQALLLVGVRDAVFSSALYVLDLGTMQVEPLEIAWPDLASSEDGIDITFVAWNEAEQRLVVQVRGNGFFEDGLLCQSLDGGAMEKLSIVSETGSAYLLSNGTLVWVKEGQAVSYAAEQLRSENKTRIAMKGFLHLSDSVYGDFASSHPHIHLLKSLTDLTMLDVEALVSKSDAVDVYALYANQLYQNILDKGYALPLDEQPDIDARAADMHPLFQSLLRDVSGQIVAMPTMVAADMKTVNRDLWLETFGEDTPYPRTYQELFELMMAWEEAFSFAYPEVNVTDDWDLSTLLLSMVEQYVLTFEQADAPLSFDEPVFTRTLDTFLRMKDSIDTERFELNASAGCPTLLSFMDVSSLFYLEDASDVLPALQMDEAHTVIRTDVVVMLGNRSTQAPQDVISLIEHCSRPESLSIETRYMLFADYDQPYTDIQGKNERKITQEGIDAYRNMLPFMKLSAGSRYLSQSDRDNPFEAAVRQAIDQLLSGAMNKNQFLSRLNQLSSAIWME